MVDGVTKMKKVTITLSQEQVDAVRALVGRGQAESISGFVQHAVASALQDEVGWSRWLDGALEETGGPLTDEERAWVDLVLRAAGDAPASRW